MDTNMGLGLGSALASGIAGMGTLKVTPEILTAKANEVLKDLNAIKQAMATIKERMDGTSSYWLGEAGNLERELFNSKEEEIEEIMKRLNEHPIDLMTMAGNYTQAENMAMDLANALTDNVII